MDLPPPHQDVHRLDRLGRIDVLDLDGHVVVTPDRDPDRIRRRELRLDDVRVVARRILKARDREMDVMAVMRDNMHITSHFVGMATMAAVLVLPRCHRSLPAPIAVVLPGGLLGRGLLSAEDDRQRRDRSGHRESE
jgi:hypothetical protein